MTEGPRYRVVRTPSVEDAPQYEEYTVRFDVVEQASAQTVLAFEGTIHENYDFLGHDSYRGVRWVTLEPDGVSLRVTECEYTSEQERIIVIPASTADGLSPKQRADGLLRAATLEATRARNLLRPMTGHYRCPNCCSPDVKDEGAHQLGNLTCLECGASELGENDQLRAWLEGPK